MQVPLILISALFVLSAPPEPVRVQCQIVPINDILVPAQEVGRLTELSIALLGTPVKAQQVLGRIDDMHALLQVEVAENKLKAAVMEAENMTNITYARQGKLFAEAELRRGIEVNKRVPGTVTKAEMDKNELQVDRAQAEVDQATMNKKIAGAQAAVSASELKAAKESLKRRIIRAEYDAQVEWLYRRRGDWVKPGDPVMRIVQMDRLWAQAFLDSEKLTPADVANQPVTITIRLPGVAEPLVFRGKIVYASDQIQEGRVFEVKAEVENRQRPDGRWLLQAGRVGQMEIAPR